MKSELLKQLQRQILTKEKELSDLKKAYESFEVLSEELLLTLLKGMGSPINFNNEPIDILDNPSGDSYKRGLVQSIIETSKGGVRKGDIEHELKRLGKYNDVIAPSGRGLTYALSGLVTSGKVITRKVSGFKGMFYYAKRDI